MDNEFRGKWFLPETPDVKIPGVLTIDPISQKIKLKFQSKIYLDGTAVSFRQHWEKSPATNFVLGDVNTLPREITLYYHSSSPQHLPITNIDDEHWEQSFSPTHVFWGKHYTNKEELKFTLYQVNFDGIHRWFSWGMPDYEISGNGNARKVQYHLHEKKVVIERLEFTIYYQPFAAVRGIGNGVIQSETISQFLFEFKESVSLEMVYKQVQTLKDFFRLATCGDIRITGESIPLDEYGDLIEIRATRHQPKGVDWKRTQEFFISPNRIQNLAILLNNWFDKIDTYQFSFEFFLTGVLPHWKKGSKSFPFVKWINDYLNVVQALESFIKRKEGFSIREDAEEYNKRKQKVISILQKEGVPQEEIDFVQGNIKKIKSGYSKASLPDLVLSTFKTHQNCVSNKVSPEAFDKYAKLIVRCRDDIAHVNDNNSADFDAKYNLYDLFCITQILFLALIGREIGMQEEEIKDSLNEIRVV